MKLRHVLTAISIATLPLAVSGQITDSQQEIINLFGQEVAEDYPRLEDIPLGLLKRGKVFTSLPENGYYIEMKTCYEPAFDAFFQQITQVGENESEQAIQYANIKIERIDTDTSETLPQDIYFEYTPDNDYILIRTDSKTLGLITRTGEISLHPTDQEVFIKLVYILGTIIGECTDEPPIKKRERRKWDALNSPIFFEMEKSKTNISVPDGYQFDQDKPSSNRKKTKVFSLEIIRA